VSVGATLSASLLAVLARPSTWPLGLLGFLVRGGWLLVVAPIVVVPTPVGLANIVAPLLEDVAFGRRTTELVAIVGVVIVAAVVWLVGGGLIAAVAEAEGVRRIAEEAGVVVGERTVGVGEQAVGVGEHAVAWRIVGVRLLAQVPLAIASAWAAVRIVALAYRELTVPSDVTVPIAWRIVAGAPDAFVALLLAWLLAEVVGAIAARSVVSARSGVREAVGFAIGRVRRRPVRMLTLGVATSAALVIVLGTTGLAAGATWNALGIELAIGDPSPLTTLLLLLFVGLFVGGLVLIGLTCAWRNAVWTVEVGGTFGGGADTRSGD
jgi:hypothetical protein